MIASIITAILSFLLGYLVSYIIRDNKRFAFYCFKDGKNLYYKVDRKLNGKA